MSENKPEKTTYTFPLKVAFPELFASDVSIHPSYTDLQLSYDVQCHQRCVSDTAKYKAQLNKELDALELMQPKAWDGVKLHRIFIRPTSLRIDRRMKDPLTTSERERVKRILKNGINA